MRELPLEKQRVLGYHVWTLAAVYHQLRLGDAAQAELSCLRGLAAAEQPLLDGHWQSAWALTGLAEPPWPQWELTNLPSHRRTHATSPLLAETRVSAAIGRTKDNAFLRKQRSERGPKTEAPGDAGSKRGGRGGGGK